MYENFFPETDEPEYKIEVKDVGNLALIAGAFDHFGLQSVIDSHIGKKGSHVQVNAGAIVKAMVCQLLNAPYQSLNGTSEYFKRRPVSTLLRDPELTAGVVNPSNLDRRSITLNAFFLFANLDHRSITLNKRP